MSKELIQSVKHCFETQFEGDPLMVFSPGRINLIGEHTDYNAGFVFPAAIDLGIVLAVKKSSSKTSRVYALNKKEMHADVEKLPLASVPWPDVNEALPEANVP